MEEPGSGSRTAWSQYEETGGGGEEKDKGGEEECSSSSFMGVTWCDSTPLLFRAADARAARQLGVVGTPAGSLARQPRQNKRLGRPLLLLHEEARLLADEAALPTGRHEGGEEEEEEGEVQKRRRRYEEWQESSYQEQRVLALEDRKRALLANGGGRQKEEAVEERLRRLEQSFAFPREAMSVQLNTARTTDRDHVQPGGLDHRTSSDETRYRVFRDLRARGFFLTPAGKFGGDFLVYPGDPLLFHGHYVAVCVRLGERLSPEDVLTVARLGSAVKKTVLLCSVDEDGDEEGRGGRVLYTSLQWSGMV